MAEKEKSAATRAAPVPAPAPSWHPSVGKLSGCPVCGVIPDLSVSVTVQTQAGKILRTWRHDPARPAAYQALVVHMHGLPAVPPGPEYPRGLPAIPGAHPEAELPEEPRSRPAKELAEAELEAAG